MSDGGPHAPPEHQGVEGRGKEGAVRRRVQQLRPEPGPEALAIIVDGREPGFGPDWASRATVGMMASSGLPAEDENPMKHMGRTSKSDAMRIATWNVNSIKQRLDHLATFVKSADPDVVCLQELKCVDEAFPRADVEALGYNVVTHGQKAYNGVAILSKRPLEDVRRGLPGDDGDEQARYLEGVVSTATGAVRVASIYLPNGNPIGTPKFDYKLAWMDRLRAHARGLLLLEEPLILCGDYNVIPEPKDAMDPAAWTNDALFQPESRSRFRGLLNSASSTRCAPATTSRASTRSGITRPAPSSETTASASTTCCSRPRRRTGCGRPRSAKRCAAGTSRPTTCR